MADSPAVPDVGRYYQGELGERYFAWQVKGGELSARLELPKFAPHVSAGDTVVDFGCGGGFLLEALEAAEKVGIEPNEAARSFGNGRGLRIVSSPSGLPDAFADVVISNHALEHTLAPVAELAELRRLLKPGGRLVLWLPLDDWRTQKRPRADENHHLYTWTPLLLSNLLEEAGYEVRSARVVTYAWPQFHEVLFRALPRRAFDVLAFAWSALRRQRQVEAVASRPRS